mgnify:CR=1 FL=1
MENKVLGKFKIQLEKVKREIERRLKILQKPPELGEGSNEDIETQESQEFVNRLSIAQSLKMRLLAVTAALLRIGGKRYGLCEKCGKKIEEAVLGVAPESRLCQYCKKQL